MRDFYASLAEKEKAMLLENIDKMDIPDSKKAEYRMIFEKGFELGFQCSKEYCDRDLQKQLTELSQLSPNELKSYNAIHKALTEIKL